MPSLDSAIGGNVDPLDAAIDAVAPDKSRLRESLYGATRQNPDEFARAAQLSRTTGIPTPIVARNLPAVQQRTTLDALDVAIDVNTPLGRKMEDPSFAALAHDDVDSLKALGDMLRPPAAPALRSGYGFGQASRDLRRAEDARAAQLDNFFRPRSAIGGSTGPEATLSSVLSGQAGVMGNTLDRLKQGLRLEYADVTGNDAMAQDALRQRGRADFREALQTPEIDNTLGRWLYGGAANIQQVAPSMLAGILTRSPAVALAGMGATMQPDAYARYRARGATPGEASLGSGIETGIEVGTEMLPMGFLVDKFGKAGAKEFIAGYLGRELPTELVANISQDAVDTAIANPDKTWGDWAASLPDTVGQTIVATLMMSGGLGGLHHVAQQMAPKDEQAANAEQAAAALAKWNEAVAASKLRARDPQTFQDFVEASAPGAEVYLDAHTLQQSGVDLAALAQASPTAAAQLPEALASGGDLVIPFSEYSARVAGTPLDPVLTPHLRTSEEALSLDEAQRYMQGQAEEFQKAAAKVMDEKIADESFKQSAKAVETKLFDQLQQAGRFTPDVNNAYAALMRDFYVATAGRVGITPEEMYARYPLQVRADSAGGTNVMDQGEMHAAERAGFDASQVWLHGTTAKRDFKTFKTGDGELGPGVYLTKDPMYANAWARGENARIMQLFIKKGDLFDLTRLKIDPNQRIGGDQERVDAAYKEIAERIVNAGKVPPTLTGMSVGDLAGRIKDTSGNQETRNKWLDMAGYVGAVDHTSQIRDQVVVFRPESIRSINAKFNPKKASSGDVLAQSPAPQTFLQKALDTLGTALGIKQPAEAPAAPEAAPGAALDMGQFFQGQAANRGEIAFVKDITQTPSVITLFKNADLSTFLHEMGHFQLEVLANIASRPDAPAAIRGDMDKVLGWFGITGSEAVTGGETAGALGQSSAEQGIRDAFAALPSVSLGTAYPITVEFNGRKQQFMARQDALKGRNPLPALHLIHLKRGRMVAGAPEAWIAQEYKLDSKNRLSPNGMPKELSEEEAQRFQANFPQQPLAQGGEDGAKPTSLPPGRTPLDVWNAMSLEEKRPYHEQFARGFESYLFEGRAPSAELNGIFARFRAWLVNVYKSVKALNVEINDDIRGVFDRLIATDEAIKATEAARAYEPLFKSAEEMGDAEAWADYQRTAAEATQQATDELQKRGLRDMRWLANARGRVLKALQADAKAKRQAVEAEVKDEVRTTPVYAVQRFLRYGELPDVERSQAARRTVTELGMVSTKLDLGALKEMYGEEANAPWRYLATGKAGLVGNEGVHPDVVAPLFGFTSGDHMVREILSAEPEKQLIEGMTDQRMLERYGDLTDPDTLARAADEAVHNEARARFVAAELKALTKSVGPARVAMQAAKAFAETMIARKQVKAIKPNQHAAAETRAAKAAEAALAKGDRATAVSEKQNQLVQNYATRLSYDALTEVDKAVKYLKKFDTEGTRKSLDADYLDQIDQLLERFDLRASVSNTAAAKRASLLAWVESQREQGFDPDVPAELLTEAQRKPYREMTLEELRGLVDTVKQIEHLGRLKHKLLTAQDEREFDAVVGDITASITANAKKSLPEARASDRGFLVSMGRLFRYAAAIHRKFSSLVRGFDGYQDGGPAWEYLVRNMNTRGDFEAVENEKATVALTRLLAPVMDKANGKMTAKQYFPEIGKSFSREERIGMLLNMGNETNLERQLTGERLSPAQLQAVVGTLTKADADFANGVWDYIDSFWPQIAEKERRVSGKAPEKVAAQPFTLTLNDGTRVAMRGGYYPIAYDPLRSERSGADLNAEVARQVQQGMYARAQTRRGHTKARSESTGRPLRYDFGEVITRHITQVVHDLAWHEYLIDANRILRSQTVENAVREHYGVEVMGELKDTLRDIAIGSMAAEKGATFWNHLRFGTTISGLAFNIFNTLQNLTGITQSMSRVGTKWVLKGAAHWAGDAVRFEGSVKQIHEKSDFMRLRAKTLQREINDIRNKVSGKDSKLTAAYFYLQTKTQLVVDVPTWWGAYEKAMAQDDMTEDKAVGLADQAVIDAQGSGQVKDLAGIQRGGAGMKLFTTFYSYFNLTFNLTAEAYGRTDFRKPGEVALFTADMVLLYALPALLSTLLKAAMKGDDDPDELAQKIAADQVSFALGTVVGLREATAGVQAALGVDQGFGYTGPASVRFFSDLYNLGKQIDQGEADEAFWKSLNSTAGTLFHYPAGQINRTASGLNALMDGRTENPMALIMGAPSNK